MRKIFLFILILSLSTVSIACPLCNIHNYLYPSIQSSAGIWKVKVVKVKGEDKVIVEILDIIRADVSDGNKVGNRKELFLYNAKEALGKEYIISNPTSQGPDFPVLSLDYEYEVRFLADSTRKIVDASEAVKMIEGISVVSNSMGFEYVEKNYKDCYRIISNRITSLRNEALKDPDYFFACYRIENLIHALLLSSDTKVKKFISQEIDSLLASPETFIDFSKVPFRGETFKGSFLKAVYESSKNDTNLHAFFKDKMIQFCRTGDTPNVIYSAYALSFDDLDKIALDGASEERKNYIAFGIYHAASYFRYWRKMEKSKDLAWEALRIASNQDLYEAIKNDFSLE